MVRGVVGLPAGLGHAGDVALVGRLAQADPAEAELAVVGARPATAAAAVVRPALELGLAPLLHLQRSLGHSRNSPCPLPLYPRLPRVASRMGSRPQPARTTRRPRRQDPRAPRASHRPRDSLPC